MTLFRKGDNEEEVYQFFENFDDAEIFGDNKLASIKSGDKYGYIDNEGKIMINPQFDEASQFIDDVAIVKSSDKYGLIDKEGYVIRKTLLAMIYYVIQAGLIGMGIIFGDLWWWILAIIWPIVFFVLMSLTSRKKAIN